MSDNSSVRMAAGKDVSLRFMLKPFQPFMENPQVTEVCVNRPGEVFTEEGGKWCFHEVPELSLDYLQRLGIAVAAYANTSFGETSPIVSAVLPDGERSQFVMPPACMDGTLSITIRKPGLTVRRIDDYVSSGFFDKILPPQDVSQEDRDLYELLRKSAAAASDKKKAEMRADFLQRAVACGKNILIAGETGSGKTTFMKALMQSIPKEERIITIEDVPELLWGLPDHHNQVNLLYPSEAGENSLITASSLMRSCLRMKPDRILLAELRGGETFDFLNVCLSGHGGTITSCHAGSSSGAFDYLALKVMQSPVGKVLPFDVIMRLLHKVLDIVVCIRNDHGRRHITELFYEPAGAARG